jgi:hypothetical protein
VGIQAKIAGIMYKATPILMNPLCARKTSRKEMVFRSEQ